MSGNTYDNPGEKKYKQDYANINKEPPKAPNRRRYGSRYPPGTEGKKPWRQGDNDWCVRIRCPNPRCRSNLAKGNMHSSWTSIQSHQALKQAFAYPQPARGDRYERWKPGRPSNTWGDLGDFVEEVTRPPSAGAGGLDARSDSPQPHNFGNSPAISVPQSPGAAARQLDDLDFDIDSFLNVDALS